MALVDKARGALETLLVGERTNIGGIIPEVDISEEYEDDLVVTEYPVDSGAAMADHAYLKPAVIRARFGWSESSTFVNSLLEGLNDAYAAGGSFSEMKQTTLKAIKSANDVYAQLLELQRMRRPISLTTKKRRYENVLIESLKTTTTSQTRNSLIVDVVFREVLVSAATKVHLKSANPKRTQGTPAEGTNGVIKL